MSGGDRFWAVRERWRLRFSAWGRYRSIFEHLLIILVVWAFCRGFLDLGAPTRLPGNESEVFQILDWVEFHALRGDGRFPLWNPYIRTGLPYFADPMLHIYNPAVSLPVLVLGVRDGFKLAVFFGFVLAALGMRQLGKRLGLSLVWRLWLAFFYSFAGQPAARFFQGQYLFILGFAWLPWIFWGLLGLQQAEPDGEAQSGRVFHLIRPGFVYGSVSALALALLFFSGNAYYAFYLLLILPVYVFFATVGFQKKFPFIRFEKQSALRFVLTGLLAVLLMGIQLVPAIEFWPRVSKHTDVVGVHTPLQVFLDYTSRDPFRPDAFQVLPAREEFYAYVGFWPFLGAALFPLAWLNADFRKRKRFLLFLLAVCSLVLVWVGLDYMPWRRIFLETRWLVQFRALLRILIFGSLALSLLAALCLESVWRQTARLHRRWPAVAILGRFVLVVFVVLGIWDIFSTNQTILHSVPIEPAAYETAAWLAGQNTFQDYERINPNNTWQDAQIAYQLRAVDAWYHFENIHPPKINSAVRTVQARPVYLLQLPQEPVDYYPDAELLGQVSGFNVYRLNDSLPVVFSVSNIILEEGQQAGPLTRSMVSPQNWVAPDVNSLETIAIGAAGDRLAVLYTNYPGWHAYLDGNQVPLVELDGYLSVAMAPGMHKYTFRFEPVSFRLGLLASLLGLGICLGLLLRGIKFSPAAIVWNRSAVETSRPQSSSRMPGLTLPDLGGLRPGRVWRSLMQIGVENALICAALLIYFLVRVIGLADWPIYFFTDEAVQTVMAADFVQQGLHNYDQEFLPTYFSNGPSYNLSNVTVYVQVLPYLLFGKSVFVTRMVSVLFSGLGVLFLALMLKNVFKLKNAWLGILLFSITPAWFLHSRTAFEPVMMTAFYAGFLYFYMRYRTDSPKALFPAVVFGALVFYTYSPGQLIMAVSAGLLFLVDLPYHLKHWRWIAWGALLAAVLALPYARYLLAHPASLTEHLSQRAPYWLEQIPFTEKLGHYFQEYLRAFNPAYWFLPNGDDLVRHLMKGYGHIWIFTLPFFVLGLAFVLRRILQPAPRTLLIGLLAAPVGSALVQINITRALVMLVPLTALSALGLIWVLTWLERRVEKFKPGLLSNSARNAFLVGSLFVFFSGVNLYMLADALRNGPLWYQDYTLSGMQYGARQLFGAVNDYAAQHPDRRLIVSPVWANGTDTVKRFFVPDSANVQLDSITGFIFERMPLDDHLVFVVVPEEYRQILDSGKFKTVQIEQMLNYPDGQPGFYFVRLQYVDNLDQILAAERAQRRKLLEADILVNGQAAHVGYSALDIGQIENAFDGNESTLMRTLEANPLVIQVDFSQERILTGLKFYIGGTNAKLTVTLYNASEPPMVFELQKQGSVTDPRAELAFGKAYSVQRLKIEMQDLSQGEPGHTHLWEIGFEQESR